MALTPQEVHEIVDELQRQFGQSRWWELGLTVVLSFAAGAAGVFFAYWRKRAEVAAEHASNARRFDEALGQMRRSAEATETVKNDIAHTFSKRSLYREKLELTLATLEKWEDVVYECYRNASAGKEIEAKPSDVMRLKALQTLYFPKCNAEFTELLRATDAIIVWTRTLAYVRKIHGTDSQEAMQFEAQAPRVGGNINRDLYDQRNLGVLKIVDDFNRAVGVFEDALIERYRGEASLPSD